MGHERRGGAKTIIAYNMQHEQQGDHVYHANPNVRTRYALRMVTRAEFRFRMEMDLLSQQWRSILSALFVLVYGVLMVFLNLSYYRYRAPENGLRFKDLGYELIPRMPEQYEGFVDLPLNIMFGFAALVLLATIRVCFPCRRGGYAAAILQDEEEDEQQQQQQTNKLVLAQEPPFIVNMIRRFGLAYALGHCLRAVTYLVTTIPGGNDRCMQPESANAHRPTLPECFYRTASVETNCGDLMFSGHLLLCVLIVCICNRYAYQATGSRRMQRAILVLGTLLTICEFVAVISARHHYTSDCVVALYVTPMMWFCFEHFNPDDLQPDVDHIVDVILSRFEEPEYLASII